MPPELALGREHALRDLLLAKDPPCTEAGAGSRKAFLEG